MTKGQKIALIFLIVVTIGFIKFAFFSSSLAPQEAEQTVEEPQQVELQEEVKDAPKSYVSVYFIGQNDSGEDVYKVVKRPYSTETGSTKLRYSIENLIKGPTKAEKGKGVYSEIPVGTRLISVTETPEKIVINLSSDFEQGGGTDGLYKRLYQLIKTANKNTALKVYLNLNGKQVDVIGGEGIMINQPLNENSLEE